MATMGLDIGGAETHIVELAKELKAQGHDIAIASNGGVYVPEIKVAGIRHYSVPMHRRNLNCMLRARGMLKEIIRRETRCIVDKCFELGKGDIAVGVCRGVESGALDVPFAPCRANAGLMLPCRDNEGAVRILNMGNLPFPQDLKDFHADKIAQRAKAEKRDASFQMVIDDVYAISKGRLVGRPR